MAEDKDTGAEGRGKVDETTRTARYEGMRADPDRVWLPYAETLAYVQQVGGTSFTVEAARSWLLRTYRDKLLAARFTHNTIRKHPEAFSYEIYPSHFSEEIAERSYERREDNHLTCYLPSIEAALGGEAGDKRQLTGVPWTAENTEWGRSELVAALRDPETGPIMKVKAVDITASSIPETRLVKKVETVHKQQSTPTIARTPGRPPVPHDLLEPELERLARVNELHADNWTADAARLSKWLEENYPNRVAKPAGIRSNKRLANKHAELTRRQQ